MGNFVSPQLCASWVLALSPGGMSRRVPVLAGSAGDPRACPHCALSLSPRSVLGHQASRINDIPDSLSLKTSRELLGSAASWIGVFFWSRDPLPTDAWRCVWTVSCCHSSYSCRKGKKKPKTPSLGVLKHFKLGLFLYNFKTLESLVGTDNVLLLGAFGVAGCCHPGMMGAADPLGSRKTQGRRRRCWESSTPSCQCWLGGTWE